MALAEWKIKHGALPGKDFEFELNGDQVDTQGLSEVHVDLVAGGEPEVAMLVLVYKGSGTIEGEGIVNVLAGDAEALEELDPDKVEEEILAKGDNTRPFSHQMLDYIKEKIG